MKKKKSCLLLFLGILLLTIIVCIVMFLIALAGTSEDTNSNLLNEEYSYLPYDELTLLPENNIPDHEIVFLSNDHSLINFIHPDGSGLETRQIRGIALTFITSHLGGHITWSTDGKYLGASFPGYPNPTCETPVLISPEGQYAICPREQDLVSQDRYWVFEDEKIIILKNCRNPNPSQVVVFDMATCTEERVLIEFEEGEYVMDAVPSTQGWLAVPRIKVVGDGSNGSVEETIEIYSIDDMKLQTIIDRGGYSLSWSKDGEWLAFLTGIGSEGPNAILYIIQKDGSGLREITKAYDFSSWSPDGKWIAFERRDGYVYKVNIETGEEVKLARGVSPSWRWDIP